MSRTAQHLINIGTIKKPLLVKEGVGGDRGDGTGSQQTVETETNQQNAKIDLHCNNTSADVTKQQHEAAPSLDSHNDPSSHPTSDDCFPPLEEWQLTFEQFLEGIQHEPNLCQFFAEQYQMDLFAATGDPLLSSYSKTFMVKSTK